MKLTWMIAICRRPGKFAEGGECLLWSRADLLSVSLRGNKLGGAVDSATLIGYRSGLDLREVAEKICRNIKLEMHPAVILFSIKSMHLLISINAVSEIEPIKNKMHQVVFVMRETLIMVFLTAAVWLAIFAAVAVLPGERRYQRKRVPARQSKGGQFNDQSFTFRE